MTKKLKHIIILLSGLILMNIVSNYFDAKIDMTADRRFTLSKTSVKVVEQIKEPMQVIVFLKGDFPSYFKRLANETENLLQDFHQENPHIDYVFINPLEKGDDYVK